MQNKKWIDISQPLNNQLAHWPGDTKFSYQLEASIEETSSANVGKITASCHNGTHIDAPFHYDNNGQKVIDIDLELCIGEAKVIDVSGNNYINASLLSGFDLKDTKRLLLHSSFPNDPSRFSSEYPSLDTDIAPFLAEKGIKLLGVDMPSVDSVEGSKHMIVHHALYKHDILILENVMLDHVSPGDYNLIALPLPIEEGDGSPVRAVIRPL